MPETDRKSVLFSLRGLLTFSGIFFLAACGNLEWPPGSSGPGLSNPPRAQAPSVRPARKPAPPAIAAPREQVVRTIPIPPSGAVTVRPGDSLFLISQRYGLSVRAVIDANRMVPPYHLIAGQRLRLPQVRSHRVESGDTLYSLSQRYGVNMHEFAQVNRISPPYQIQTGRFLQIPYAPVQVSRVEPPAASRAPRPQASPKPSEPSGRSSNNVRRPSPKPVVRNTRPVPQAAPRPRSSGRILWPVRGRVASGFGPKGGGLYNDGINILAKRGTPVRAADKGVVAYSGNELRGFGNLLLIKHSNGWITAYAHNEKLLVRRGAKVGRGQIIARVGATGNVSVPQLHFEIRDGKNAIDPRRYLQPLRAGDPSSRS